MFRRGSWRQVESLCTPRVTPMLNDAGIGEGRREREKKNSADSYQSRRRGVSLSDRFD